MLFIHEDNLKNKIKTDYKGKGKIIQKFYDDEYLKMRDKLLNLKFRKNNMDIFETFAKEATSYYNKLIKFSSANSITSQSKFESTYLEELSVYLFSNLEEIKNGKYGVFNKKVYAGLKIDKDDNIVIIPKDVDFCIGKKVNIKIDEQHETELIIPIVAVEVKTYLDATMFGEVKSSSRSIRSASPNSKTYLLMGWKAIADEHIIAARQDSFLSEIYVLKKDENSEFDAKTIYEYWCDITSAIKSVNEEIEIKTPGKLLFPNK